MSFLLNISRIENNLDTKAVHILSDRENSIQARCYER
ncbi:hypothetical protein NIES4072_56150 [Nostoc commune NIES-4072]|uniref:Uncharacterized protein n=1 Tax=Nostoc commune NIES-4072 TaxID=2005467 RepID=A0A2R5FT34_NOSCO|nr:hypothetical protein NIES4070_34780 [Nostoc commune HK-02]GBG21926.1 hypothetical protein NIES4072_56150 [Nostoc commune NIES-4072]